ncbi:unnamed protein product [Amaranthus hypochondriacus]
MNVGRTIPKHVHETTSVVQVCVYGLRQAFMSADIVCQTELKLVLSIMSVALATASGNGEQCAATKQHPLSNPAHQNSDEVTSREETNQPAVVDVHSASSNQTRSILSIRSDEAIKISMLVLRL